MKLIRLSCFFAFLILLSAPVAAQEKHDREDSGWSSLSEEEQKELREALRKVWSDPVVMSARENVTRSAREYHGAVRESIGKQDPETARLLERVQKDQTGFIHTAMGGSGRKKHIHGSSIGRLTQMIAPPGVMDKMTDEQKERFRAASAEAKKKPEVVAAIEDLKSLSKEDEEIRRKKMNAFRTFRHAYFDAIVEIDPELKEYLPPPGSHFPPKGFSPKGKGKGPKPPENSTN